MMKQDTTEKRIKDARTDPLYDKLIGQLQVNPFGVVVIDPRDKAESEDGKLQAQVWERWQGYLGSCGRRKTLKTWKAILASGGKLTLPCLDPNEMDPSHMREDRRQNRYWDK